MKKWLMAGGDRRMEHMARLLMQDGYDVHTLGLFAHDEERPLPKQVDAVVLPYPFAVRDGCIPTFTGLTLHARDVLGAVGEEVPVLAGRGAEEYVSAQRLIALHDCEALAQKNAELSAEGALCELMQRTPLAVCDMTVLVTGYGRFARALALRLRALGATVWVAARKALQRDLARSEGMHAVDIVQIARIVPQLDVLCNTVPARIITQEMLDLLPKRCCLLELASAPYGFDMAAARALGLTCDVLPALPARYCPHSAAMALKEACTRLLSEVSQ